MCAYPVISRVATLCWLILLACQPSRQERAQALPETIDFNDHIRPILSDRCYACHGPDAQQRKADLRLDRQENAFAFSQDDPQRAIIDPGHPGQSELIRRIRAQDPEVVMPPPESHLDLSDHEVALLEKWIEQGAPWEKHWAFIPPERPPLPQQAGSVDSPAPGHPIDRFIRHRLALEGIQPGPPVDKATWLRRASLTLTGLPPSLDAQAAFEADTHAQAYEHAVDALLASPHYGEQQAVHWLDLARYADTHGYTVDRYREHWRWRQWVIEAFNQNMPFDQFLTWQLAGDLIPNRSRDQLLATGFNRNHPQNMEGGIVNEEFRAAYVMDRTETLGTGLLGMTLQCARCHDHKYDDISQQEYYQLYSFFNQVDEAGQISWDNALPVPTMLLPDKKSEKEILDIQQAIDQLEKHPPEVAAAEGGFQQWIGSGRWKQDLSQALKKGLLAHYPLENLQPDRIPNAAQRSFPGKVIDPVTRQLANTLPTAVESPFGTGRQLNGDDALYFPELGIFDRFQPFSIALWAWVPRDLSEGVIFHKNEGGIIYNFRGYALGILDDQWDIRLAHTFPYNAIHLTGTGEIPRETWLHLTLTYEGNSHAAGVQLYIDGKAQTLRVLRDNLYKGLTFNRKEGEPGLKIGARWRSKGFTRGRVDEIRVYNRALSAWEVQQLAVPEHQQSLSKDFLDLAQEEQTRIRNHYLLNHHPGTLSQKEQVQNLRKALHQVQEKIPEAMVIEEMKDPRPTFVLNRGNYDQPGEAVQPGTPEAILPFPDSLPPNRLGLAKWLTSPDHPLLARVTVNRLWQQCFGKGLVKSTEDFGNQGEMPTHPRLLDWLATELIQSGWDQKHLLRLIVLSDTYRQDALPSSVALEKDPGNQWYSRFPATRLSAEMLRDQALFASGLLYDTLGGPSVKPYQPEGLWQVNSGHYEPDRGRKLYRRSLYTFWKRSVPPPTMNMFDAPSRSYCVVRRQKTSTPLQALALWNDPQFVEAARVLAERVQAMDAQPDQQVTWAFRLLCARRPRPRELDLLLQLYREKKAAYLAEPEKAQILIRQGAHPVDKQWPAATTAALTTVVNTLMNYDAATHLR